MLKNNLLIVKNHLLSETVGMAQDMYYCLECKKTALVETGKKPPICCGKPMKKQPLDICLQPSHPEHARSSTVDDACDDFRAGGATEKDMTVCDVCESDIPAGDATQVHIKGKVKKICPECATAIKGIS